MPATFEQKSAVVIAILCILSLLVMHFYPVPAPDLIVPDAIKATLGLCIFFLFGSTSGSRKKDDANTDALKNMTTQLGQSMPCVPPATTVAGSEK